MRQILARICLLGVLLSLSGCGPQADTPVKEVSDDVRKQKMEEARAAQEKGMQQAESQKGSPPVNQ